MVGEQQLQGSLAVGNDLGRVSEDFHVGGNGVNTGSAKAAGTLDLNNAETASANRVDVLQVA